MSLSKLWEIVKDRELFCPLGQKESETTQPLNNTFTIKLKYLPVRPQILMQPLQQKPTAFQPFSLPPIVTEQIFIHFPIQSLNISHVFFIRIFLYIGYGPKHHFLILYCPPPTLNCSAQISFHLSFQQDTHILVFLGNFPHHYFHLTNSLSSKSISAWSQLNLGLNCLIT